MWWSKIIFVSSACFCLTACGFHPLYTTYSKNTTIAYPLKIETIPDRNGQILRNYLVDILIPEGTPKKPKYYLNIKLTESIRNIGINKDETTSRQEAVMTALITLKNCNNKVLYLHTVKAINSFGVLSQNYYSDMTAKEYAKKEALKLLAEKIKLSISTYLDQPHEN